MTIAEKIFALKSIHPFDLLRDSEIVLIAQEARVKQYAAGEMVSGPEKPLRRLHVVTQGAVTAVTNGAELPIFGVKPLLYNQDTNDTLTAGGDGATCLTIKRGNFFTIANECPSLIVGFVELAEQGQLL